MKEKENHVILQGGPSQGGPPFNHESILVMNFNITHSLVSGSAVVNTVRKTLNAYAHVNIFIQHHMYKRKICMYLSFFVHLMQ